MQQTSAMLGVVRGFADAREMLGHRRLAQLEEERFVVGGSGAQGYRRLVVGHVEARGRAGR
jgi:hypothetical protein